MYYCHNDDSPTTSSNEDTFLQDFLGILNRSLQNVGKKSLIHNGLANMFIYLTTTQYRVISLQGVTVNVNDY